MHFLKEPKENNTSLTL